MPTPVEEAVHDALATVKDPEIHRPITDLRMVSSVTVRPDGVAELGILLEARAMHTGRSARNHLLALAQTNGVSRRRVDELIDMVGLIAVAGKRVVGGCMDGAMTR